MVFIKRHLALLQIMSISLILFVACKPGVPNRYIQPSELGDILYEYHLAEGITSLKNDTTALYYYKNNIFFINPSNVSDPTKTFVKVFGTSPLINNENFPVNKS